MSLEVNTRTGMSDVSIEMGHFYAEAFRSNPEVPLARRFEKVKDWATTGKSVYAAGGRASTVFLIDDYSAQYRPRRIIPQILDAAAEAKITIDYLAREAACVKFARYMLDSLVTTDTFVEDLRPGLSYWLRNAPRGCDGNKAGRFRFEGELYSKETRNEWACAHLAAVWQLLRLGVLHNADFDTPPLLGRDISIEKRWDDMPGLLQINPDAAPFQAHATYSILPNQFIEVENLVKEIITKLPWSEKADQVQHTFLVGL